MDIQHLNDIYGDFEGSYIVRMEYISGDYVDKDLLGHMEQKNDLKVTFVFVNPPDKCLSA